ncbi:MAG: WD repeat-containing protein [Amphiamblys sp. WSBS2006]|nr:MAG: WD repeat-containing protein [Amphiamblys sp. WSBS2006]
MRPDYTPPWSCFALAPCTEGSETLFSVGSFERKGSHQQIHSVTDFEKTHQYNIDALPEKMMYVSRDTLAVLSHDIVFLRGDRTEIPFRTQQPSLSFDVHSADGNTFALAKTDGAINIVDVHSPNTADLVSVAKHPLFDVSFSAYPETLFSCGEDGSVRLIDRRCLKYYDTLYRGNSPVLRIEANRRDINTVSFFGINKTLTTLDLRNTRCASHTADTPHPPTALCWSLSSRNTLAFSDKHACYLLNTGTGSVTRRKMFLSDRIHSVCALSTGFLVGAKKRVFLWP